MSDTKVYLVSSGCLFEGGGTNAVFSSHDLAVAYAEKMVENMNRCKPTWDEDYLPMTKVAVDLWKNDMDFVEVNSFVLDPSSEDLVVFESTDKP